MSRSDALGPYPVIRHFYPIDPKSSVQQQAAVYNEPDFPLVAPILPMPAQQPQEPRGKKPKKKVSLNLKVKAPGSVSDTFVGRSSHGKMARQSRLRSPRKDLNPLSALRRPRQTVYVEIAVSKSFDRASHRRLSVKSLSLYPQLGRSRRRNHTRVLSSPVPFTKVSQSLSPLPAASDKSYDPDSDSNVLQYNISIEEKRKTSRTQERIKSARGRPARLAARVKDGMDEDEATTCHQCRRKTTREKMSCRKLQSNGIVCSFRFCQVCIEVRYDEPFEPFHCTWHCPRCRGICNCSICLRKAGFGYILDGPASEQFTGTQGRLSVPNRLKTSRGKVKTSGESGAGRVQPQVSVQTWLARKGIALGSEACMEERREQGVRLVVGMSPPPLGTPSPYVEARLNASLVAWENASHDDAADEDDDVGFPLDPVLRGEGGISPRRVPASSAFDGGGGVSSSQATAMNPQQWQLADGGLAVDHRVDDSTTPNFHDPPLSHPSLFQMATMGPSSPPLAPTEDLPGLSSVQTRHVRLYVGKLRSTNKRSGTLKMKKRRKGKPNKDANDSDNDSVRTISTGYNVGIRSFHKVPIVGPSSTVEYGVSRSYTEDSPPTPQPPPPPEPVFVPTEDYTPLKLDATRVRDPHAQFGHSYLLFNAFNTHSHDQELEHGHGRGTSLSPFRQTPLCSYPEMYQDPHLLPGDLSPGGPAKFGTGSGSCSTSRVDARHPGLVAPMLAPSSCTPDDYLTTGIHAREHGYMTSGIPSFGTLVDTWMPASDPGAISSLDLDVPPPPMESVTHAGHEALKSASMHGGGY